jgi:hypothetical protein
VLGFVLPRGQRSPFIAACFHTAYAKVNTGIPPLDLIGQAPLLANSLRSTHDAAFDCGHQPARRFVAPGDD